MKILALWEKKALSENGPWLLVKRLVDGGQVIQEARLAIQKLEEDLLHPDDERDKIVIQEMIDQYDRIIGAPYQQIGKWLRTEIEIDQLPNPFRTIEVPFLPGSLLHFPHPRIIAISDSDSNPNIGYI